MYLIKRAQCEFLLVALAHTTDAGLKCSIVGCNEGKREVNEVAGEKPSSLLKTFCSVVLHKSSFKAILIKLIQAAKCLPFDIKYSSYGCFACSNFPRK